MIQEPSTDTFFDFYDEGSGKISLTIRERWAEKNRRELRKLSEFDWSLFDSEGPYEVNFANDSIEISYHHPVNGTGAFNDDICYLSSDLHYLLCVDSTAGDVDVFERPENA